jgi:type II secretory pathway component PulF
MPTFRYAARDPQGQLIQGTLDAESERAVAVSLAQLGYHPLNIAEKQPPREKKGLAFAALPGPRIDRKEAIIVLRELASLLKAGIPLASCLEGVTRQARSPGLRQALEEVSQRVTSGTSLSEALAAHPRPPVPWINRSSNLLYSAPKSLRCARASALRWFIPWS